MAISSDQSILSLLKVFYKDGVSNLMFRNDPLLKKLNKVHIEGKQYDFSAMYGRGGACSADYTVAKKVAAQNTKNAEFSVEPGQLFSACSYNQKELLASKNNPGAYMKVAGAKFFAAGEAFRKQLAAAVYGRGFGELALNSYEGAVTSGTSFEITLPVSAIMAIDIDSQLVVKASVGATAVKTRLTVTAIDDAAGKATVVPDTSTTLAATDVIAFDGSIDSSGNALLPMGLGGWLPTIGRRSGSTWTDYIKTPFFGVNRSVAPSRLAGAFVDGTGDAKKSATLLKLIKQVRRQGSKADIIVLNDEDWKDISDEIQNTNTYMSETKTTGKRQFNVGVDKFSVSFSTNFFESVIDTPYCPKGTFYVLDSDAIELATYTNTDKINDGVTDNEPGKADPLADGFDAEQAYKLNVADYITVQPGADTIDGPSTVVSMNLYGGVVVTNPSNCGVGLFSDAEVLE